MLLLSVLLFLGIIVGITVNMMASFMPFINQMNNMQNYYNAHYGSISAVEQGLLASKYGSAGFVGTGTGNLEYSDIFSRGKEITWKVKAKTNKIADNNINYLYGRINDSTKKGKLDYYRVVPISFTLDTSKSFSNQKKIGKSNAQEVSWEYSIPKDLNIPDSIKTQLDKNMENLTDSNTQGWIAVSGFNMVKQDGVLYLWLDNTFKTQDGKKLPLLEYSLDFSKDTNPADIGDKKFEIIGTSKVKDYTSKITVEKATKEILSPEFKKTLFPSKPQ